MGFLPLLALHRTQQVLCPRSLLPESYLYLVLLAGGCLWGCGVLLGVPGKDHLGYLRLLVYVHFLAECGEVSGVPGRDHLGYLQLLIYVHFLAGCGEF